MPGNEAERRFTESEFALILRRAIQLDADSVRVSQNAPPPATLPPGGLTLKEIEEIAAEVGVDPARVVEAVDWLGTPEWSKLARVFGGPAKMNAERSLARLLPPEEMGRLLDVARRLLDTQGESHEVLGGVEWKKSSWVSLVSVRVAPEGEGARLSVAVDRGGAAFLSHYIPILGGLGLAGITLGILDPVAWQVIAGIVAGGAATGYAVGRTIWVRATRKWRNLMERLTSEIGELSESSVRDNRLPRGDEPFTS
jgi:hypothetical protein